MNNLYFIQSEEQKDRICHEYNDCSVCPLAVHKPLFSTAKHICARDFTKEEYAFESEDYTDPFPKGGECGNSL